MFKEIIAISKNYAIVKIDNVITDDLLNLNVVFEENNKKMLQKVFILIVKMKSIMELIHQVAEMKR